MKKLLAICLALTMCWIVPLAAAEEDRFANLWSWIDGSTATIPLVQAMRVHFFDQGMAREGVHLDLEVEHSTTSRAYEKLCDGDVDLIFVTPPSPEDLAIAEEAGVELEIIPVTREALVFLNNVLNPVESLAVQELRDIYTGRVTSWSEVGGEDAAILPYQRPPRSGSQTLFLACLMGDETPMAPTMNLVLDSMSRLVDQVSAYNNAPNALGYSVFYFATRMYMNENVRVLAVDGVMPSPQTISDGTYPLCTNYFAVLRKDTPPDDPARELVAWLLSNEGQRVAAQAGYVPMEGMPIELEVDAQARARFYESSGTGGTKSRSHVFYDLYEDEIPELPADVHALANQWWGRAAREIGLYVTGPSVWYDDDEYEDYDYDYEEFDPASTAIINLFMRAERRWDEDYDDWQYGDYNLRTAVVDIEQKKILQLSDLFYDGVNYIDYINRNIAFSAGSTTLHWEELSFGPSEENNLSVFTGLPNDYPYFLFYDEHTIELLFDSDNPFWRDDGNDWTSQPRIFVPLNHWVSPWGRCTVDITYREHPLPGGEVFHVPSLRIDDGHVPEAEAKINARLAEIAGEHIRSYDEWVPEWLQRVEIGYYSTGHYVTVYFRIVVGEPGTQTSIRGTLTGGKFNLHTGEWLDTDEIFDRWKDSPQVIYEGQQSRDIPFEPMPGYHPPEGLRPISASLGYSAEREATLFYEISDIPELWMRMRLPLSLLANKNGE
ncbi:MAG: substrate-binding domain-containing protein [Clostridia bacterium]|nr:substrate-binding domain-containing protein [Clostridia bacterium]